MFDLNEEVYMIGEKIEARGYIYARHNKDGTVYYDVNIYNGEHSDFIIRVTDVPEENIISKEEYEREYKEG